MMFGKSEWMMMIFKAGTIEYRSLCFLPFEIYVEDSSFRKIHAVSQCLVRLIGKYVVFTLISPIHTYPNVASMFWHEKTCHFGWDDWMTAGHETGEARFGFNALGVGEPNKKRLAGWRQKHEDGKKHIIRLYVKLRTSYIISHILIGV